MDRRKSNSTVDHLYPDKTPFTVKFETDTWIFLLDLDDDSAASIMDSADWVIASLRVYRGILSKKVYFLDTREGLLEITHNGEEKTGIIRCSHSQRVSIERLIQSQRTQSNEHGSDPDRREYL